MESLKKHIAELHGEQLSRDELLDEQLKMLLNDLVSTKDVKRLLLLLKNNEEQIKHLNQSENISSEYGSLVSVVNAQLAEMRELIVAQEKNLISYKKDAENKLRSYKKEALLYKTKLDRALNNKLFKSVSNQADSKDSKPEKDQGTNAFKLGSQQKVKRDDKDSVGQDIPVLKNAVQKKKKVKKPAPMPSIKKHADGRDDLTAINKISPKLEKLLNDKGITTIAQIAEWTPQDVKARDARLVFRGRISQEKWVDQARAIIKITSKA